jgi:parallel beta-helix repeat protein
VAAGNPTVRNNAIHDGKRYGVHVHFRGRGVFEGNRIAGNALPGFAATGSSDPTVRNNTISGGDSCGVFVAGDATAWTPAFSPSRIRVERIPACAGTALPEMSLPSKVPRPLS